MPEFSLKVCINYRFGIFGTQYTPPPPPLVAYAYAQFYSILIVRMKKQLFAEET